MEVNDLLSIAVWQKWRRRRTSTQNY